MSHQALRRRSANEFYPRHHSSREGHSTIDINPRRNLIDIRKSREPQNKENHLIDSRISRNPLHTKPTNSIGDEYYRPPSYRKEHLYENIDIDMYLDNSETTFTTTATSKSLDLEVGSRPTCALKKAYSWRFPFGRKQNVKKTLLEVSGDLVPGEHPPHLEAKIVNKMKTIALTKATQGFWEESYVILLKIFSCEKSSLIGGDHPEVANTLYHMSVALYNLGKYEKALNFLENGLRILYPRRLHEMNLDLAAIYYQIAAVHGKMHDLKSAFNHLDLCRQVEEYILGHDTKRTKLKEAELKCLARHSQKPLRRSSF